MTIAVDFGRKATKQQTKRPYKTERLLMGRKESKQTNVISDTEGIIYLYLLSSFYRLLSIFVNWTPLSGYSSKQ